MPKKPRLIIKNDQGEERVESIDSDRVEIGRDEYCDITIDEPRSSRTHCAVEKTADGWQVVDLESRNGTKVSGEFTNQKDLEEGDCIGIGDTELEFRTSAPPDKTPGPGLSRPDETPGPPPSIEGDADETPASDEDPSGPEESASSDREEKRTRPEEDRPDGPSGERARPALSRGKTGAERGIGRGSVQDTKVQEDSPTIRIWFWIVIGALVVAQGVVYVIVQYRRSQRQQSRSAYREANENYLNGRYEEAIASYRKVGSATPDLQDRSRGRMQRAKQALNEQKRLKRMYQVQKKFYSFLDKLESEPRTVNELNRKINEFKRKVRSSVSGETGGRLSTFLKDVDRVRRRMRRSIRSSSSDGGSRLEWNKLKASVEDMRGKDRFGPAVNRLLEFQFITDRTNYDRKADELISDLVAEAKLHTSRRLSTFRQMIENDRGREAHRQSAETLKTIRSYHPVLHRLSLNLYDLRQKIREKLDTSAE